MLPVAALDDVCVLADPLALAVRGGVRTTDSVAPTPAGCPVELVATAPPCTPWLDTQDTKLLAALPATDCATDGVIAAHGSFEE
jgi:hypothetical protein